MDIGFLLYRIQDIGREFSRSAATVIVQGDEDAKLPSLIVYRVVRGGLNWVSLILDSLCHGLNVSLSVWADHQRVANLSTRAQTVHLALVRGPVNA